MGLSINYRIHAPVGVNPADAKRLLTAMHSLAVGMRQRQLLQTVRRVQPAAGSDFPLLNEWQLVTVDAHTSRGIAVPPRDGGFFLVELGDDAEPLTLGLCSYPDAVFDPVNGRRRKVSRTGWRFASSCKTQYAHLHGWEHFRRCHVAAIELLAGFQQLGLQVVIDDEGGYWPSRDVAALREKIRRYDGLVAAFAGMIKDAGDEAGLENIRAPILAHPSFEHVEAEGQAQHGKKLRQALKIVRQMRRKR
jgi:hypothetical protein